MVALVTDDGQDGNIYHRQHDKTDEGQPVFGIAQVDDYLVAVNTVFLPFPALQINGYGDQEQPEQHEGGQHGKVTSAA